MKRLFRISGIFMVFTLEVSLFSGWGCSRDRSDRAGLAPGVRVTGKAGKTVPDTICFTDPAAGDLVCFTGQVRTSLVLGPWKTNLAADSVTWEVAGIPGGMCIEPVSGKGDRALVTLSRGKAGPGGVIMIKAVPYRSECISRSALFAYSLKTVPHTAVTGKITAVHAPAMERPEADFQSPAMAKPSAVEADGRPCKPDTARVNMRRRITITEFRDLLYMYAHTADSREKEYFRSGVLKKLGEFPGKMAGILPGNDTGSLFKEPFPPGFSVLPVYDAHRCYIVGVQVKGR